MTSHPSDVSQPRILRQSCEVAADPGREWRTSLSHFCLPPPRGCRLIMDQGQSLGSGPTIQIRDSHLDQGQPPGSEAATCIRDSHLDQGQPSGSLIAAWNADNYLQYIRDSHLDWGQPSAIQATIWIRLRLIRAGRCHTAERYILLALRG